MNIEPDSLSWTGTESVEPGSEGVVKYVQIENLGSTNISYVWFNNSYPHHNPYGSGLSSMYDPGNYILISRHGENHYRHPNRIDYNSSYHIIYLTLPSSSWYYGRFRDGPREFFWAVDNSTGTGAGNGFAREGTTLRIGVRPHNSTDTGTVDLSGTCDGLNATSITHDCREGTLAHWGNWNGQEWAYVGVHFGNDTYYEEYTFAINRWGNMSYIGYWNTEGPGGTYAFNQYFVNDTNPLYPGGAVIADVIVRVPYGVAFGEANTGTLTVIAQATNVEN